MIQLIEKTYIFLFLCFLGLYVFLIYPWGVSYYYANVKAYYFMGWIFLLSLLFLLAVLLRRNKLAWKWTKVETTMIVFLLLNVFSTLHSLKISLVGEGTEHQGLLIILSCVILFSLTSRLHSVHLKMACQLIIISSLFAAVYSILQYYHLAFLPQDSVAKFGGRTFSFFDNPDYFGSYLVLVIPLTITAVLLSQDRKSQILYFFIFCTQFLSLIESQTRSAWLGIAIGFFIVSAWIFWKWKGLLKKWVLIILAACLIFTLSNIASHQRDLSRAVTITHDVKKIISNKDAGSAGASRWDIWQISLPLIATHFWLGTGPNTFEQAFYSQDVKKIKKYMGTGNKIYDENNDYLQIALTMGVPALLVYLLILYIIVSRGVRKIKELDNQQKLISIGLLAAIIGYLVQAFFNISVVSVAPYFWFILGFLVNQNRGHAA